MAIRSHIGRAMDFSLRSNRIIALGSALAGTVGVVLVIAGDRSIWLPIQAVGVTFALWALARELDPDRDASALIAAALAGLWALAGFAVDLWPMVGLILSARLIVESTGRRPLRTDLLAMTILATVISFTALGWVGGFGLAVALYVDNRMAEEPNMEAVIAALAAGLGSAALASLLGVFSRNVPSVLPVLGIAAGALSVVAVLREPPHPISLVDSRKKTFMRPDRLHAGRVTVGLLLVLGVLVGGRHAPALIPALLALTISLVSSEVERLTRVRR
jgi:hypothetical protein